MIHHAIAYINSADRIYTVVADNELAQRSVYVVGSIDGDLIYLVTLLKQYEMPPNSHFIFLG
ncbi:unnamed protein product [Onchocerca flexuosa]|uniref:Uncharacterized protein n=1 Tax=Onchocerca flexuosa TaxID=387005 RepID=A0A3P7ULH1_9BILA|nr:unnamed protein product [Onchocerca flexuosa]